MKLWTGLLALCLTFILPFTGLAQELHNGTASQFPAETEASLMEGAAEFYVRFAQLCLAQGDETADVAMRRKSPREEEGGYIPIEGTELWMKGGDPPMYIFTITNTQRIDVAREHTLYADFIQALDPEVSMQDAANIAAILIEDAEPLLGNISLMAVHHAPWRYQYMRSDDPSVQPPMLTVFPLSAIEDWELEVETSSFEETEKLADEVYADFRSLCVEAGLQLLPETLAEPDFSDSETVLMTRIILDTAEWSSVYLHDSLVGFSLCIHKDTPANQRLEELQSLAAFAVSQHYPMGKVETLLATARDNMSMEGDGVGRGRAQDKEIVLILAEDENRQALIFSIPSLQVEGIPEKPKVEHSSEALLRMDATAYPIFRLLCEESGFTLLPDLMLPSHATAERTQVLENVEWGRRYADGELRNIFLLIATDKSVVSKDITLMTHFVRAVFDLTEDEATEVLTEAVIATVESSDGIAVVQVEGNLFRGSLAYGKTSEGLILSVMQPLEE